MKFRNIRFKEKKNKKGQVALEFIMMYGWAILIVLAVIFSIFYFDTFDLRSRMPQQAILPQPFVISDYGTNTNGNVFFVVSNQLEYNVSISQSGYHGSEECEDISNFLSNETNVESSEEFKISFTCPDLAGERSSFYVTFRYNNTFNKVAHNYTAYFVLNG